MQVSELTIPRDVHSIETWLRDAVARHLDLRVEDVPVDSHMVNLGMSSRDAVALTGDIDNTFAAAAGVEIDPAIIFDRPTIRSLASYLSGLLAREGA